jgi:hypothetical protein
VFIVLNSIWSCAVSTFVYLRNRTFSRAVGPSGGVPLTLLTVVEPKASKFHVFDCIIFAKIPYELRHKLGEKAFRGVMVCYPLTHRGTVYVIQVHAASLPPCTSCYKRRSPTSMPLGGPSFPSSMPFRNMQWTHMTGLSSLPSIARSPLLSSDRIWRIRCQSVSPLPHPSVFVTTCSDP